MNTPRGLGLLFCLLAVGGRYAAEVSYGAGAGDAWQRGIEVLVVALCAFVVYRFSAGDPPRRPWTVLLLAMAVVPLIRIATWQSWSIAGVQLQNILLIFGNIFFAGSIIGFGRVLGGSELLSERTGGARARALLVVGSLALAGLAFIAYNVFELASRGMPSTSDAWAGAITSGISTLSDAFVFAGGLYLVWLLRPIVGGSIALPYLLMAFGGAAFLVVDVWLVATGKTAQTDLTDTTAKLIGALAFSCFAAAALIQATLLAPKPPRVSGPAAAARAARRA
ncbi:hypothetical protein SAMN02745121_00657 [Nannocystis exedens]|uniref:Uncharacterized protein n=1 Tax=Nannocystis exedens TaxID=54 RepID=A0A1I1TEA3_9BACT|nr:hypothetical protein [Nannocystis exedens]PCC66617.1 hypothetical protein NAEX_09206 [Nannocystis exedens]SFD56961.1 hypothetical protein SAMN02745121_00657 [Nannocystis exedens]